MEQVEKATGRRPAELDVPDIPDGFEYLLSLFYALHLGRKGADPIAYEAILAYSQLNDVTLTAFEVETVKRLDMAWIGVQNA